MSFGIKALKRTESGKEGKGGQRQHIPTVILGQDLAAVLKLVELKRELPPEKLRLITPRLITRDWLIETYQNCISTLRDNETTLQIQAKFSRASSTRVDAEPLFYKEGGWHRFGGRAKPMELASGEAYFQAPRQDLGLAGLFSEADWNELDHILHSYQNVRVLESLEKKDPSDLVNRDEWWMLFRDLGEVTCNDLWLSLPSKQVLKASQQGSALPVEMAHYFAGIKRQAALCLTWVFGQEIYPEARTLFIPQSMTHEWGHFVLDVHAWNAASGTQLVSALILLQEEEPTSEFMADKIKLCKRVLDRAFPNFERHLKHEHIHASEDYFEEVGTEQDPESLLVALPSLHLLGAYGTSSIEAKYLARALLTL